MLQKLYQLISESTNKLDKKKLDVKHKSSFGNKSENKENARMKIKTPKKVNKLTKKPTLKIETDLYDKRKNRSEIRNSTPI